MLVCSTKHHGESDAAELAKFIAWPVIAGTAVSLLVHTFSGDRDASHLLWTRPGTFTYGGQRYTTSELQLRRSAVACAAPPERTFYAKASPRTALASFPRSGNTFTRELFEHSTGYFTSDVECGSVAMPAYFLPGCDQPSDLLVKTHSPVRPDDQAKLGLTLDYVRLWHRQQHVVARDGELRPGRVCGS